MSTLHHNKLLCITLLDSQDCFTFKINMPLTLQHLKEIILPYVQCIDCLNHITINKLRLTFDGILLIDANYHYLKHLDKVAVRVHDNRALFPFSVSMSQNQNMVNIDENLIQDQVMIIDNQMNDNCEFNNYDNQTIQNCHSLKRKRSMIDAITDYFQTSSINHLDCEEYTSNNSNYIDFKWEKRCKI